MTRADTRSRSLGDDGVDGLLEGTGRRRRTGAPSSSRRAAPRRAPGAGAGPGPGLMGERGSALGHFAKPGGARVAARDREDPDDTRGRDRPVSGGVARAGPRARMRGSLSAILRPHVRDVDLVEPGVEVRLEGFEVALRVRIRTRRSRGRLPRDQAARPARSARGRQDLGQLAGQPGVGPEPVGVLACPRPCSRPRPPCSRLGRLAPPPLAEAVEHLRRRGMVISRRRSGGELDRLAGRNRRRGSRAASSGRCRCGRSRPCSACRGGCTPPFHSSRMTSTASSSISRRIFGLGQASPRMCSLSASPLPIPSRNRPASRTALCRRLGDHRRVDPHVGQVTAVVTGRSHQR